MFCKLELRARLASGRGQFSSRLNAAHEELAGFFQSEVGQAA